MARAEKTFLKVLAQIKPAGTSAISAYTPATGVKAYVKKIIICNTTASSARFSIYLDQDGTTYDQTTALYYSVIITANNTTELFTYQPDGWLPMNDAAGNLAIQTDTGSALTFTVIGEEY